MNIRQQLYKKYRLEGMSKYASARKAGYSHNYASQAKIIENNINMQHLAEMAGLTDNKLVEYIKERLEAKKVIAADIFIRDDNGKLTVNKNSNDWIEVPDYIAQHKFLETLLKVTNKLKPDTGINISSTVVNMPKHTLIFQDIKETNVSNGTDKTADNLHAPEGTAGHRLTGQI